MFDPKVKYLNLYIMSWCNTVHSVLHPSVVTTTHHYLWMSCKWSLMTGVTVTTMLTMMINNTITDDVNEILQWNETLWYDEFTGNKYGQYVCKADKEILMTAVWWMPREPRQLMLLLLDMLQSNGYMFFWVNTSVSWLIVIGEASLSTDA